MGKNIMRCSYDNQINENIQTNNKNTNNIDSQNH